MPDKFVSLVGGPKVRAPIVHARLGQRVPPGCAAVIPVASPGYWEATLGAACVITERGGAGSHLAELLTEEGVVFCRMENARKNLPEGHVLLLDTAIESYWVFEKDDPRRHTADFKKE